MFYAEKFKELQKKQPIIAEFLLATAKSRVEFLGRAAAEGLDNKEFELLEKFKKYCSNTGVLKATLDSTEVNDLRSLLSYAQFGEAI